MRISDLIRNENQTIKWVKDEFQAGNLYVDNSFQRRYVWLKKHQISLIETILLGYVIPEIYIWEVGTDPESGDTKYSIVDGQQRIGAIVAFINGEFSLNKNYLSDENARYAGKKFADLDPDDKKNIWGYSLSFRRILNDVNKEDIVNLFLRLNSTDKSLNPQELRNAEFNGLFLKNALDIAENEFWKKYGVFGSDSLRRMGDVEFISSLLIFLRKGVNSDISQTDINQIYDLYNEVYEEAEEDKLIVDNILKNIDKAVEYDNSRSLKVYVKKTTHLYTMFVAIYKFVQKDGALSDEYINNLISFYKNYENATDKRSEEYRTLLQGGTRAKTNRLQRTTILCDIIEGKNEIN